MEKIKNNIFYLGEKDIDRKLFDQLVPLPQGTTYNSYLIKGSEKTALIDTMYPTKIEQYIAKMQAQGIDKIDYIICNHAEQDHSGALPVLLEKYKTAKVVTNAKCKELIQSMLFVDEDKFIMINDNEELSLGDKTLQFILAPWVHWPDTMFTYVKEDGMLFTCDFFGAHYTKTVDSGIFADCSPELSDAAKRYYAEIMMPFRTFAKKYLEKVKIMQPSMILPSHGPIWDKPDTILSLYEDWTSEEVRNFVLIPYVSMYNSTKMMVERLEKSLLAKGIKVKSFDLVGGDEGELATYLIDAATVVIGASMVLAGPHPVAVCATYLINMLRPQTKFYSIIGSYGWAGNLTGAIENLLTIIKPEKLEYVIVKGQPRESDFIKIDELAEQILQKHKELSLI